MRVADARLHSRELIERGTAPNEFAVSGADNAVNLLLGSVFFVWSLLQQSSLQHSVHFVGIVCWLFAAFAAIGWLQQRVAQAAAADELHSVAVERYTLRLISIASGYLGGLLVRLLVDLLTNGPRVGAFGLANLLLPFGTIVCLFCLFEQLRIVSGSSLRVRRALAAADARVG